jgi:hypothetical protein
MSKKKTIDREKPKTVPVTPWAPAIRPRRRPIAKARRATPTYPGMWSLPRAAAKGIPARMEKQAKSKGATTGSFAATAATCSGETSVLSVLANTMLGGITG